MSYKYAKNIYFLINMLRINILHKENFNIFIYNLFYVLLWFVFICNFCFTFYYYCFYFDLGFFHVFVAHLFVYMTQRLQHTCICGCVWSWVSFLPWPFTLCLQLYETGAKDHGKGALSIPSLFEANKKDCQGHRSALSLLFSALTAAMLAMVIKPNLLKYAMLKIFA